MAALQPHVGCRNHRITSAALFGDSSHRRFHRPGCVVIVQDADCCDVTFDWKLTANKPLLRYLSFLLRPAFEANHRWAMEQGRRSLELELARGRATSFEELIAVPSPPQANELIRFDVLAGAVLSAGIIAVFWPALAYSNPDD